uniref:Uncharacterized protein n=1 Tax=Steinernema glaseri TaxID=37863 RepID=A0A1I7YKV9_9BILA
MLSHWVSTPTYFRYWTSVTTSKHDRMKIENGGVLLPRAKKLFAQVEEVYRVQDPVLHVGGVRGRSGKALRISAPCALWTVPEFLGEELEFARKHASKISHLEFSNGNSGVHKQRYQRGHSQKQSYDGNTESCGIVGPTAEHLGWTNDSHKIIYV